MSDENVDAVTTPGDLLGLVPVGVDPGDKTVDLMDVDPAEFTEPFFEFTVRRLRKDPKQKVITVAWDDLIEQAASWDDRSDVAALIFNVGRCGSTMLSNMLKAHPDLWVLSEPEPLAKPELVLRRTPDLRIRTRVEAVYRANALLLQYRAAQSGLRLVIKYPSWLAARGHAMAANHPEASIIGLYRNPYEVVASYIQRPPQFSDGMHQPAAIQMSVTPALATAATGPLTGAAYYAAIWVSTMVGAMAVEDERLLLMSYEQLKADAAACVAPVMSHVGVELSDDILAAALATTDHYAKSRTSTDVAFDPKGTHARQPLMKRTRAEVERIVDSMEERLLAHPRHMELTT